MSKIIEVPHPASGVMVRVHAEQQVWVTACDLATIVGATNTHTFLRDIGVGTRARRRSNRRSSQTVVIDPIGVRSCLRDHPQVWEWVRDELLPQLPAPPAGTPRFDRAATTKGKLLYKHRTVLRCQAGHLVAAMQRDVHQNELLRAADYAPLRRLTARLLLLWRLYPLVGGGAFVLVVALLS